MRKKEDIVKLVFELWQDNKMLKNKIKLLEQENRELKEKLFGVEYV